MPDATGGSLNLQWAQWMVEELYRLGCRRFYLGFGSRSTPWTVAAARHPGIDATVCVDERGAAFAALGYGRATGVAAAVVTTSGTAVANCAPAVVEAALDGVPLLVLTSDRPAELIDVGANQTLRQSGFFGTHVRWQADLPAADRAVPAGFVRGTIDQAYSRCHGLWPGPVQVNWMIREPFLGADDAADDPAAAPPRPSGQPWTRIETPPQGLDEDTCHRWVERLNRTERGLVVVGRLDHDAERRAVRRLLARLGWPVYADVGSGLRLADVGTHMIRHFDQALMPPSFVERVRPEGVLHLGGRVVSKRLGLFLQDAPPPWHAVVRPGPDRYDPVYTVSDRLSASVEAVAGAWADRVQSRADADWVRCHRTLSAQVTRVIAETLEASDELSEPWIARRLTAQIPEGWALFVSNSMPVRDIDLYGVWHRCDIRVGLNRGASGIDGILASAVGFAEGTGRPATLLIGDLALLHDASSLTLLAKSRVPVVVVVVNNRGGGIFHFLPVSGQTDVFEEYFLGTHSFDFAGMAASVDCPYVRIRSQEHWNQLYPEACRSGQSAVLEVSTDSHAGFLLRKRIKHDILTLFKEA